MLNRHVSNDSKCLVTLNTSVYNLADPKEESVEILKTIVSNNKHICDVCLNNEINLKEALNEINLVKMDLIKFSNSTNTKQDIITKFSNYINRINLVRLFIYQINEVLDLSTQCKHYKYNLNIFDTINKKSNQLVEVIQNSIRKQSLNVNFIVLS